MKKILAKLRSLIPSKRKIIQLYAALLFNANIKGYITGKIYQGNLKSMCAPGINCYSCPGAVGACPLGSLQGALNKSNHRTPYYVVGILFLYGIIFGRFICGFLCPFGLIQELLHKIKTPKLKKSRITRVLSYLKYVILTFFVVIIPILYGLRDVPLPAFCKYICPAGTIEGAFGLLSNKVNEGMFSMLGPLFTWKFILTVSIVTASVFVFRFFCRFLCPLGALYGLFNKFSIVGIKLDKSKCTSCGLCTAKCKMDIKKVGDQECISCGECMSACPTGAIQWKGSKAFVIPTEPEIAEGATADEIEIAKQDFEKQTKKLKRRNKVLKAVIALLMIGLLATVVITVNSSDPYTPEIGNEVGDKCPSFSLPVLDENGIKDVTVDPSNLYSEITIINFWGTWCSGCVKELPYFDRIASEYEGKVKVVAVHTFLDIDTAPDYISEYYPNSDMIFVHDSRTDPENKYSPEAYYTALGGTNGMYPMTVVLDREGVIIASYIRSVTYDELQKLVEDNLTK